MRRGAERADGLARGLVAMVVALAALLALPAMSGAATICVSIEAPGCESSAATVQAALDAAGNSAAGDRVVLGAGVFEGPFAYSAPGGGGRIELVGQGPATVLTAPPASSPSIVLDLPSDIDGDGSAVANLTVRVPANGNATADTGIFAEVVSNVRVASESYEAEAAAPVGIGILAGGSVRGSVVELVGGGEGGIGVETVGGSGTPPEGIYDSRITAPTAIKASAPATSVVRSRIVTTDAFGVLACSGPATVEDSLIRIAAGGVGLLASGENLCGATAGSLIARQDTIVGAGTATGQVGVGVRAGAAGQQPSAEVSLSIIREVQYAFTETSTAGASASAAVGASDFDLARHSELAGGGSATFRTTEPNIEADPLFSDELLGDFSLRPGSPAIDSSFSPPLAAGESTTDLAGNPRVLDGNGDGVAARDMGAYEAPAVAARPDTTPPDTRILQAKKKKKLKAGPHGFAFKVAFVSTEAGSTFQCRLDSGRFTACSSPFQKRLAAGSHRFEVRAIDAAGNVDPTPAHETIRIAGARHGHRGRKLHRAF